MPVNSFTGYAALAAMLGALACGGSKAQTDDTPEPEQAGAARDTATDTLATEADTAGGQAQDPPGYRGMERDTTLAPPSEQTPSDTFLQQQGQGQPQDTAGYGGLERPDTTGQAQPSQTDTTGFGQDTTGAAGVGDTSGMAPTDTSQVPPTDTTQMDPSGLDTTGTAGTDTTGYNPSQEQTRDTTAK
jgi:hypothetical protein